MVKEVLLVLLCLLIATNANCQSMNPSLIQQLAKEYSAATSENKKMAICIEAINSGVLCRGCSLSVIDQLFGTNYTNALPQKGSPMAIGVVDFLDRPVAAMADSAVSAPIRGWYLAFEYDYLGRIQNYYLSNLHK